MNRLGAVADRGSVPAFNSMLAKAASEELVFLIADDRGLFVRPELDQQSGSTLYNDPARVRQRHTQFDQAWDTSITDPDLRSFLL